MHIQLQFERDKTEKCDRSNLCFNEFDDQNSYSVKNEPESLIFKTPALSTIDKLTRSNIIKAIKEEIKILHSTVSDLEKQLSSFDDQFKM